MDPPSLHSTTRVMVGSDADVDVGNLGSALRMHHSYMINNANHFKPDSTSILCIYKVFDHLIVQW
jgi:hypothetical protein